GRALSTAIDTILSDVIFIHISPLSYHQDIRMSQHLCIYVHESSSINIAAVYAWPVDGYRWAGWTECSVG
ncbi:hypothetical protein ACLKQF_11065, partial [Aeromonas salmonicida]